MSRRRAGPAAREPLPGAPLTTARHAAEGAPGGGWQVVVPLKHLPRAKSRLARLDRGRLVQAFAQDVLAAVLGTAAVTGVSVVADESWARSLPAGVERVPDPQNGLNGAIRAALVRVPSPHATAVILGDLPCLTPPAVGAVLAAAAAAGSWVAVPDSDGSGTTMLVGPAGHLRPHFGTDSLARHSAAGAEVLWDAPAGARRDVDDAAALRAAVLQGVGRFTASALAGNEGTG